MSPQMRGARAAGLTPPPFVTGGRRVAGLSLPARGGRRGSWWRGLNGNGKIAIYVSVLLVIALSAVLGVSAGSGNGATVQPKVERVQGPTLKDLGSAISRNLLKMEITLGSIRLEMLLGKIAALAPQVQARVLEISKVVQGARCQGYMAMLGSVSDTTKPRKRRDREYAPNDPEDVWRYANRLAETNLPRFQSLLEEAVEGHTALVALAIPRTMGPDHDRLLEQSGHTYTALRYYIRGLELLTDCNEMTVGQAVELYQKATEMVMGTVFSL